MLDHGLTTEVGPERFRNNNGSVLLLIVFHYRYPRTPDCQAGSIERVHESHFPAAGGPVTDVRAPGLEIVEVAA